tara:strand:- start:193 stop:606 length:414 start_codon:yes stop_codon:yes gene_type:complete
MLGGGNPVGGSNPSGTGTTINYIGKHAYAYSSAFEANVTPVTALNFNTGAEYIVGVFTLNAGLQYAQTDVAPTYMRIKFNDEQVLVVNTAEPGADSPSFGEQKIIIPPFTTVLVECWSSANDVNDLGNARFVGEVYA